MICEKCGAEINNNNKFCEKCGAEIKIKPIIQNMERADSTDKPGESKNQNSSLSWNEWEIVGMPIGEGAYGKVYKAVKEDHGVEMFSAIKIITIPKNPSELKSLCQEGMAINESKTYLKEIVGNYVNEIKMMINLNNSPNIVSVYDYKLIEKTEEIGWEIHIRMELLTSFEDYIYEKSLTESEVIKVGIDICSALELCAEQMPPIIHRDIKPANIFITKSGDFKLGDFGVARELEKTKGSYTAAGTPPYMAPEVKNGNSYGVTADICSLGVVLYRLMNNNRLPFCDPYKQKLNSDERAEALTKRLNGEQNLSAPVNATAQMSQVILKAVAFDPKDRFQSASEFKIALEAVATGKLPIQPTGQINTPQKKKGKNLFLITAILLVIIIGIGAGIYYYNTNLNNPINLLKKYIEEYNYVKAAAIINDKIIDDEEKFDSANNYLTNKTKEIVDDYINETKTYDEALTNLENIRKLDVIANDEIMKSIENVNSMRLSRNAYQTAQNYINSHDFENAIEELRKVDENDKNYSNAQQQLTSSITSYKENTLKMASDYETAKNFDEAINLLKKSQILLPNDVDISSRIEKNIKNIISETKQNAENTKNYSDEISKLKQLQTKNPDNQDITNAISEIEKIHMNYLFSQSDNLADQKKYEDAIQLLSDNKDLYPNLTADFNQKIKEYRDIMPMLLYNLVYFFRRGYTV